MESLIKGVSRFIKETRYIFLPAVVYTDSRKEKAAALVRRLVANEIAEKRLSGVVPTFYEVSSRSFDYNTVVIVDVKDYTNPQSVHELLETFNWVIVVDFDINSILEIYRGSLSFANLPCPAHIARKKFLFLNDLGIVYVMNEKAACTYISSSLVGISENCSNTRDNFEEFADKYLACSGHYIHTILDRTNNLFRFTVVRNPYARLVSAYLNVLGGQEDSPKGLQVLCRNYFNLPTQGKVQFPKFVYALKCMGFAWSSPASHWLPQAVTTMYGTIKYEAIGYLEHLNEFITEVLIPEFHTRGYRGKQIFSGIPLNSSGAGDRYISFYDDRIKNEVYKLYEIDFDTYKYPKALV